MGSLTSETLTLYLVRLMIIFMINPLHEFAHAWTAYKLGDNTAKNEGRLTLSPLAHLDGLGSLLLLIFGFGWAKPVPVAPSHFKKPRLGMMLTSLAGPATNLLAAIIAVISFRLLGCSQYVDALGFWENYDQSTEFYLAYMLHEFISVNLTLCLFNMIPVPPLDGSRVMTYFLPPRASLWLMRNHRFFHSAIMRLIVIGVLSYPIFWLKMLLELFLFRLTGFIPAVM